jgi:hypothetical protein
MATLQATVQMMAMVRVLQDTKYAQRSNTDFRLDVQAMAMGTSSEMAS